MPVGAAGGAGEALDRHPKPGWGVGSAKAGPGHVAQPLGSHSPGDTVGKGSELCGPVPVLVSAVLPALTPGLSMARQGLPTHSHAFEDLVEHQALESRLASPRGD